MNSNAMTNSSKTPTATVVVVPRERESVAIASLRSIYEHTKQPFDLVYVDCLLPRKIRKEILKLLDSHGDKYIRAKDYTYPNQARNLGIAEAKGDYIAFLDNDVFVEPGWLEELIRCAEETGAGVVGPLYLEGDRRNPLVHCAGGTIDYVENPDKTRTIITCQHELGTPLADMPELSREPTELIEFHCVLISRSCLDAIGGRLDEQLLTTREHVDLCLLAKQAGFDVYLEPKSQVGYGNKEKMTLGDLRFFQFRWAEQATLDTIARFESKWDVKLDPERVEIIRKRRRNAMQTAVDENSLAFLRPFWRLIRPLVPQRLRIKIIGAK